MIKERGEYHERTFFTLSECCKNRISMLARQGYKIDAPALRAELESLPESFDRYIAFAKKLMPIEKRADFTYNEPDGLDEIEAERPAGARDTASRIFQLDETIIHLPITDTDKMWYVKITDKDSGVQFGEFYFALTEGKPDFYCPLYLQELAGKTVELSCEDERVPAGLFDGIIAGGTIEEREDLYPGIYKEESRQQVHFSSRWGWLNDPNGLVFADGAHFKEYRGLS